MSQGYFLIALGQRYIVEASLLANTIKKHDESRPIALLINPEDLDYAKSFGCFDEYVPFDPTVDEETYKDCNNNFEKFCIYVRINFDKILPYDETINLDTDVLCQYNPDHLWEYLSQSDFPVRTLGKKRCDAHWHWNQGYNISQIVGKHIPAVHCGLIYIRKSKTTDKFYASVREKFLNYDKYGCKRFFRGSRTEEACYSLAFSEFDASPIEYHEYPVMTFNLDKNEVLPSKKQILIDDNNVPFEMSNYIPFIHMWEKMEGDNFKSLYERIMK